MYMDQDTATLADGYYGSDYYRCAVGSTTWARRIKKGKGWHKNLRRQTTDGQATGMEVHKMWIYFA